LWWTGTYTAFFNATVAGKFELHITESGETISGMPVAYTISPGPVDVAECVVTGVPQGSVAVGHPIQLSINSRDRFRNASAPDHPFHVSVVTPSGQTAKLSCQAASSTVFLYARPSLKLMVLGGGGANLALESKVRVHASHGGQSPGAHQLQRRAPSRLALSRVGRLSRRR
jgi:hypothetical protein